jgi:GH24 family phage-related lysozyme (muramidase)
MIYFGIVEDRNDPLKLGRCKVRIVGLHSSSRDELSTDDLPWAYPIQPITSAAISGIGHAPVGLVEGSWVCVTFRDKFKQIPIMLGSIGGIPTEGESITEYTQTNFYTVTPVSLIKSYSSDIIGIAKSFEPFKETAVFSETLNAYLIGYGSKVIDGSPVAQDAKITQEKAEAQLKLDLDESFLQIQQLVRAPITQSMVDALVLVNNSLGKSAFSQSDILQQVNTSNYAQAAVSIQALAVNNNQKKRRAVEKTLFLRDGMPTTATDKPPVQEQVVTDDAFMSPNGKYPLYMNEPDTNKLARHEDVGSTVVAFKEAARVVNIPVANGANADGSPVTWSQPEIPYNSEYPFNKVFASESGHLLEFDDTQGSERVHIYHKAGTYTEIDCNGTQVNRIVGDSFEILERNGYVYINGNLNVNVRGASTLNVSGTMDVSISGAANINILNDANVRVSGNANLMVANDLKASATSMTFETQSFNLKSHGPLNIQGAEVNIKSDSTLNVGYTSGSFGSFAANAQTTGVDLSQLPPTATPTNIVMSELSVPTRTFREASVYETPDEGDSTAFRQARIDGGTLSKSESAPVKSTDVKESTEVLPKNTIQPPVSSCDIIFGMNDIPKNLQLSKNFNLLGLTANGSRTLRDQVGLTKQQIACNLKGLCESCLEPILEQYPNIIITSGFRRPGDVPGSSARSQHYNGEAADLVFKGFSKKQVYDAVHEIQKLVPYDQLLLEYSGSSTVWVHVSFNYRGPRKQSFTMKNHVRVSPFGKYLLL